MLKTEALISAQHERVIVRQSYTKHAETVIELHCLSISAEHTAASLAHARPYR